MKRSPISINIVAWNSMRFLPELLESIMGQTYQDFNVLIIDNASDDGVETFVREKYPEVTFLRNARNLGFSAAHNQGIRYVIEHADGDLRDQFILVTNPDVILEENFLERLLTTTKSTPEVGTYGGKLLRAFGENLGDEMFQQTVRSDILDSAGLNPHRNRTVTDRGAGDLDEGQYNQQEQVFGISGALVMYRASALQDVREGDTYFDPDFFAYKEDVDMAWRLQHAGWDALYVPSAVAYHYRGMYGPEKTGMWEKIRQRKTKSSLRNYFSTRNHWMMLVKNFHLWNAVVSLPWWLPYELARFVYVILFESQRVKLLLDSFRLKRIMLKKRRRIMRSRKRTAKEIRAWFR